MGAFLSVILRGTSSAFAGIWGYVGVGVVSAVLVSSSVGYVVHRVDTAAYTELQLRDAKAVTAIAEQTTEAVTAEKNIEIAEAKASVQQAINEAAAQQKIVVHTKVVHDEIPVFITPAVNARTCIPVGLVRLLYASTASDSKDGATALGLSASEPDDACSSINAADLAGWIITNNSIAEQNAEQLNALEAAIVDKIDKYNNPSVPISEQLGPMPTTQ